MPWPDLQSLHLLTVVAKHGSGGKAAAEIGLTQASASRRLTTLERSLGVPLLVRGSTGSRLTTQGRVVVDCPRCVLDASVDPLFGVDALKQQQQAAWASPRA